MSVLEFIAAIKWPVTVLILAGCTAIVLRRSPQTRRSIAASIAVWLRGRNLRFNFPGGEFEATVAETQGSIDAAISPDAELAEAIGPPLETEAGQHNERMATDQEVENARRNAVASVARNAARLGWQWGRGERGSSEPIVAVTWDTAGHPTVSVLPKVSPEAVKRLLDTINTDITLDDMRRAMTLAGIQSPGGIPNPAARPSESDTPDSR